MRSNFLRDVLLGSFLLLCIVTVGSPSQVAAQDTGTLPADTHDDHDGFNEGLLGLVGLAGLLGLKRRDRDDRDDTRRANVSRPATSRV